MKSTEPQEMLRRRGSCKKRFLLKTMRWAAVVLFVAALVLLAGWSALPLVRLPPGLFLTPVPQLEFLDRNGHLLRTVRHEDGPFGQPASYAEIPQPLVQATLAAEDQRFWLHPGVDWRASLRAVWQWTVHGRVISGGSTITQQLIKLVAPRPRTLRTKCIEALRALRVEQIWDKQRILAEYLNRVDYGNFIQGCAAAAQFYFCKPLNELSPAECAFLAGLPQAPSRLNPHTHFDRAHKRQQWILSRMRRAGFLTEAEFNRASQEQLRLGGRKRVFEAPHFIDLVLQQGGTAYPEPANESPGVGSAPRLATRWGHRQALTTLDLDLNRFAEQALRRQLVHLRAQGVGNGAAVVIDNRNGDVLALVGSENYFVPDAGQVNGAWAPRSAGSAFKPFTYLLAFEHGATPATVVADVPTEFPTSTGVFAPVNYNRRCYGPMRYRLALANSLNISAVKVLASIGGPEPLLQMLQACGLTTLNRRADDYGLGLTIGNAEARLLELANAYACLARLGEYRPYRALLDSAPITNRPRRVADEAASYLIADILSDNAARMLAFGAESPLRFGFPVACKTGTSSDFRDNWAFGFTPEFTVGIWVGNFNGAPMREVSGVTGAAPILHELFDYLHEQHGTTWYSKPENVLECWIHPLTGKRLNQSGAIQIAASVKEMFLAAILPQTESLEDYDSSGRVRLGTEYHDWLASADNWLPGSAVLGQPENSLHISFPLPGTTFYVDPDLPEHGRRVHLRAEGSGNLQWRSDSLHFIWERGQQIAVLAEGRHRLKVRDPRTAAEAETWIEVLGR